MSYDDLRRALDGFDFGIPPSSDPAYLAGMQYGATVALRHTARADTAGLREAAIDVDNAWTAEEGQVIKWAPHAADALETLRAALAARSEQRAEGLTYVKAWRAWEAFEGKAADRGSGATQGQMTGAAMML